ncbi:MAG: PilZ domain-containing protein [Deltaproteobacteria bacterium]|nr:PilZ domain-containing protein [Deltaproteobacteria bacterium]
MKNPPTSGIENRRFPRKHLEKHLFHFYLAQGFQEFTLLNISQGGISFLSKNTHPLGTKLKANFKNLFELDIEVTRETMVMTDENMMEAHYSIGARFLGGPLDIEIFQQILKALEQNQAAST